MMTLFRHYEKDAPRGRPRVVGRRRADRWDTKVEQIEPKEGKGEVYLTATGTKCVCRSRARFCCSRPHRGRLTKQATQPPAAPGNLPLRPRTATHQSEAGMSNDERLTPGWKVTIAVTLVLSVFSLSASVFGNRADPRTADHQQRIRDLESKINELQATGGGTKPKDRSYGE